MNCLKQYGIISSKAGSRLLKQPGILYLCLYSVLEFQMNQLEIDCNVLEILVDMLEINYHDLETTVNLPKLIVMIWYPLNKPIEGIQVLKVNIRLFKIISTGSSPAVGGIAA